MGIFTRPDSKWWWIHNEKTKARTATDIPIGTTTAQRRDSKRRAEDRYHQVMLDGSAGHTTTITFKALAAWYAREHLPTLKGADREQERLKNLLASENWTVRHAQAATAALWLARVRAGFDAYPVDAIDTTLVTEWRTARLHAQRVIEHFGGKHGPRRVVPRPSPRTVNDEVNQLKRILAKGIPKYRAQPLVIPELETTKRPKRYMTADEEARILPHLRPDDLAFFLVGLDALVRLGDILDLQWTDDHGTHLTIRDPKERNTYDVAISPRLRTALDALPKTSAYIFPRRRLARTARDQRGTIRDMLEAACQRAGVPYGRNQNGVTFHHGTRRTGATKLIRQGGQKVVGTVAKMGGWKDAYMLLKEYEEVTLADQQAAVLNLHTPAPVSRRGKKRPARASLNPAPASRQA